MTTEKSLDTLTDAALASLLKRKREEQSRADSLIAEDKRAIAVTSAALAKVEIENIDPTRVEALRDALAQRVAQHTGRVGGRVAANAALEQAEAELQRRAVARAQATADRARAALDDYAQSLTQEITTAATTITTMLAELRARVQACRDATFAARAADGGRPTPTILNQNDDVAVALETALTGSAEVARLLERFASGDLDAQLSARLASEARERQQLQQRTHAIAGSDT